MTKTKTILQNINQDEKKVMSQMKAQDKIPGKQLNEVETGNVLENEFRIMIVKTIQDLGKTGEDARNVYQRPRRTKEQRKIKNTLKVKVKSLSCVQLFATPWTAAYQAPLSMGFSRQEYWIGVP